jgi:hypothetical protein
MSGLDGSARRNIDIFVAHRGEKRHVNEASCPSYLRDIARLVKASFLAAQMAIIFTRWLELVFRFFFKRKKV